MRRPRVGRRVSLFDLIPAIHRPCRSMCHFTQKVVQFLGVVEMLHQMLVQTMSLCSPSTFHTGSRFVGKFFTRTKHKIWMFFSKKVWRFCSADSKLAANTSLPLPPPFFPVPCNLASKGGDKENKQIHTKNKPSQTQNTTNNLLMMGLWLKKEHLAGCFLYVYFPKPCTEKNMLRMIPVLMQ